MTERGDTADAPFSELAVLARPAALQPPPQGPWFARWLERLLRYLPVLLMGLAAAFTWWLVKNAPSGDEAAAPTAPPRTPDYTMRGFVLSSYGVDGALRSQVEGDVMAHFPASDTIEIEGVRLRALDEAGRLLRGSAARAQSNGDGTEVRLIGGARVVREPAAGEAADERVEIRGEFLEVFSRAQRVRSDQPVTVVTGQGELRAGTLDYDRIERVARLGGRVTGQLRGGGPVLP
ncbi:MAG TPA: LPS export ABC transporter periplasmic protein LptC [Methylibium sp.]|nr:LPS export ABC transporter periplasmic protein LptC [Methylibium sp.]